MEIHKEMIIGDIGAKGRVDQTTFDLNVPVLPKKKKKT